MTSLTLVPSMKCTRNFSRNHIQPGQPTRQENYLWEQTLK
uniref:(California timema) hypothetical protein n=1 Tax=Timema californicum TaxID=61474 RepID=A0A7R9JHQ9_TIMCA|nr:unnamed protein product [Timema californicum]